MTGAAYHQALVAARELEREQAHFYRALAVNAEAVADDPLSERLQELHADEQHHLSRLSARLLELGHPSNPATVPAISIPLLSGWEAVAREREAVEVQRYASLLDEDLDPATRKLVEQILEVERHHLRELGGKWTPA
jgi:rubrerythrin